MSPDPAILGIEAEPKQTRLAAEPAPIGAYALDFTNYAELQEHAARIGLLSSSVES